MSNRLRNPAILAFTSVVWGLAFVAQSKGGETVDPYLFNAVRFTAAALLLYALMPLFSKLGLAEKRPVFVGGEVRKTTIRAGIVTGVFLSIASNLQQAAISMGAPAGKAGFLTACYMLFVPLFNFVIFRKRLGVNILLAVGIAVAGMYLLCLTRGGSWRKEDLLLLLCAVVFSFQILSIDRFSGKTDPIRFAALEFLVAGLLSFIPSCFTAFGRAGFAATVSSLTTPDALLCLGYAAVFSSAVGYTLQIVGQRGVDPTVAGIIMSLESVFSALAGWLILRQTLNGRQIAGCAMIFAGVVLAQLDLPALSSRRDPGRS
ncbi:MAG: DMT family transporter [Clostridia bacterium]|nr:DMT family transporter [Clostridia bacterium]